MEKLAEILHELIEHAIPHPNRRGELHTAVDQAVAPAANVSTADVPPAEGAPGTITTDEGSSEVVHPPAAPDVAADAK